MADMEKIYDDLISINLYRLKLLEPPGMFDGNLGN